MNKKIKIKNIILLFFLCLLVLIHIDYFIEIRATISNNEQFYIKELQVYGSSDITPRHVADRFVWSFCLSSYFLIGYLWSAGQQYYRKINMQGNNKFSLYAGVEFICQIGILLPYLFCWIGDTDDINAPAFNPVWLCTRLITNTHYYLYDTEEWIRKYHDIFVRSVVLAPIIMQIFVYGIYTLVQYIQYKRKKCLERKWKIRHFIYISFLLLIMTWIFIIGMYC